METPVDQRLLQTPRSGLATSIAHHRLDAILQTRWYQHMNPDESLVSPVQPLGGLSPMATPVAPTPVLRQPTTSDLSRIVRPQSFSKFPSPRSSACPTPTSDRLQAAVLRLAAQQQTAPAVGIPVYPQPAATPVRAAPSPPAYLQPCVSFQP